MVPLTSPPIYNVVTRHMNTNQRDRDKVVKGGSYDAVNILRGTCMQAVKVDNDFRGFDITLVFQEFSLYPYPLHLMRNYRWFTRI